MSNLLADRLKEAMKGPPKITGVMLAKACGVKPPSVSDWLTGKSKTMEGANLLAASRLLGVNPEWLATGKGPMRHHLAAHHLVAHHLVAREPSTIQNYVVLSPDEHREISELLNQLDRDQLKETISFMKWQLANKSPPHDGQALSVAGG